jgi:hypothetical protein
MSDLIGGRYPVTYPFAKALGLASNASQGNITVRSNGEFPLMGALADGALAASEVGCVVAVPVENGDLFTKVTIPIGATKGKKVEAGFGALYAAVNAKGKAEEQPLLGQSKSAALAEGVLAEEPLVFTLEKGVLITPAFAPNGFIYVVIALEAETMPTAAVFSTPKSVQNGLAKTNPNGPVAYGGTVGAGLKTKASATLGAIASKAVTPYVQLS